MEDPLAPFAGLLEDDTDVVQGPFSLQEVNDYGHLYEYSSGFADFCVVDAGFESKLEHQTDVQSPESILIHTRFAEVTDQSDTSEQPKLVADDFADISATHGKVDEASNSDHKNGFQFSESADIGPADSELRSEVLELLSIFQAVYENKSAVDKPSLLKKCVSMCERIMERYYRLPQVVAMHEQAKALLQVFENGETESPFAGSTASSSFAGESSTSSGMSFRDHLKADVKEALDRVDRDAEETELSKDPNEGEVVDGVYIVKGIWYCKTHVELEQCDKCGVDYRLLNQVHRERTEVDQVDDSILKEQQRLEELELQRIVPPQSDPAIQETPTLVSTHQDSDDAEDFQSIAKDMNAELARAREKDEADFLKCFASFQIS
ncbi:hypothetical protein M758_4G270400 [Ceratodon purpureus]|nr:hypothetical protein M758_4G270400 [Ceratodon purpureus]